MDATQDPTPTTRDTLTGFLLARIAEDEAVVDAVGDDTLSDGGAISTGDDPWPSEQAFAERFTTSRMRAKCEADRRIVEQYVAAERNAAYWTHDTLSTDPRSAWEIPVEMALRVVIQTLAGVYADHPDYREEWAE